MNIGPKYMFLMYACVKLVVFSLQFFPTIYFPLNNKTFLPLTVKSDLKLFMCVVVVLTIDESINLDLDDGSIFCGRKHV